MAAYITDRGGEPRLDVPVNLELKFDPANPISISALFTGELVEDEAQEWVFGRDLMMRGSVSLQRTGDGDVRFQYLGPQRGGVIMCLNNPTGHADVWLNQEQLVNFLEETAELVEVGAEDMTELIDEALKELLG